MNTRNTHQKEIIQSIMQGEGVHMHAEDVLKKAKELDDSIGLATIYRNLNNLVEQGKIQKVEGYYDANPKPHDHFLCMKCGMICDVKSKYDESLDAKVSKELHVKMIRHFTTYEGICENCLKDSEGE